PFVRRKNYAIVAGHWSRRSTTTSTLVGAAPFVGIAAGQLPSHRPASVVGAPGTGGLCDACNRSLLPTHLVMDVPAPDALVHLHAVCFSLWDDERRLAARTS